MWNGKLAAIAVALVMGATALAIATAGNASSYVDWRVKADDPLLGVLSGKAPYDGPPYVVDGMIRVMLAGPEIELPASPLDSRPDWTAWFADQHEPFAAHVTKLAARYGAEVTATVPAANTVFIEVQKSRIDDILIQDFRADNRIALAGLDWHGAVYLVDGIEGDLGLMNDASVPLTDAPVFHAAGLKGEGVIIAGIDTGIDETHSCFMPGPGFSGSKIVLWQDFINGINGNPYDDHSHGTHTAGTAAGDDTGCAHPGMAPNALLMGVKMLSSGGSGSWEGAQSALQWAFDNGADVGTNSWGGGCSGGGTVTETLVDNLGAAGFDLAFAAGNSGPGGGSIICPGRAAFAVTAGATDVGKVIAGFSSRGPCDDPNAIAPPQDVCPDVVAVGVNVPSAFPGGGYGTYSGTSMATPHVAGGIALIEQANRQFLGRDNLAPGSDALLAPVFSEAEHLLKNFAEDLGSVGPDNNYGYGFIRLAGILDDILARSAPILDMGMLASAASIGVGQSADVTTTVENLGAVQTRGEVTIDRFAGDCATGTLRDSRIVPATLNAGDSFFDVFAEVADLATLPGTYCAQASYAFEWTKYTGEIFNDAIGPVSASFEVVRPLVDAVKTLTPDPASVGGSVNVAVLIPNAGNAAALGASYRETVPLVLLVPAPGLEGTSLNVYSRLASPQPDRVLIDVVNAAAIFEWDDLGDIAAGSALGISLDLLAGAPGSYPLEGDLAYGDFLGNAYTEDVDETLNVT